MTDCNCCENRRFWLPGECQPLASLAPRKENNYANVNKYRQRQRSRNKGVAQFTISPIYKITGTISEKG